MKFRSSRLGSAQSLLALSVSFAVIFSSNIIAFGSLAKSRPASDVTLRQTGAPQSELRLISATATATAAGILLQWHTNSATDNLGFNVYRVKAGQRARVNKEIIPGALFAPGAQAQLRGGYSYSWFDRGGAADSIYYIESVNLQGTASIHGPLSPVTSRTASEFAQTSGALSGGNASAAESPDSLEKYYPAGAQINSPAGAIEDQWAIAAQTGLKIAIKKDGWYRVTQSQMVAAGFNPTVDIRNLRLFVDAQEVAINTSQHNGPFTTGDYIEFYGRGLDIPTTDASTYYLIAGTTPGKRVRGQNQLDEDPILPPAPSPTSLPPGPPVSTASTASPVLLDPIFYRWVQRDLNVSAESLSTSNASEKRAAKENDNSRTGYSRLDSVPSQDLQRENSPGDTPPAHSKSTNTPLVSAIPVDPVAAISVDKSSPSPTLPVLTKQPVAKASPSMARVHRRFRKSLSKKRKRGKFRRQLKQKRNHASASSTSVNAAPANFDYTAERKDRGVYFVSVLNGDQENFFGQVITFNSTNPASQTINTPNPDLAAAGTARLEIALQGVNQVVHQISIEFNGVIVGSFSFFGYDPGSGGHPVQVFDIPVSQLHNGANTIRFILPAGGDVSLVDYVKLTYPHLFRADTSVSLPATQSLRFMLRGTQSVIVDDFSTPSVRLIDYTDPLSVAITRPASAPSGSGFAITVPATDPPVKAPRLLYAIADGQFDQPAALTLNQPSNLNQGILSPTIAAGADFLIVSHKNFIPNLAPLLSQRQSQGMTAATVDVEDIYDEFSFGLHGPQAIKDFLLYASTHWTTKPRYVVFAGDASFDPRNYTNVGNFDFVPTKLVDATFNETASDDWLTDFDNDKIANIPVGRLPLRSAADADLVISKIVGFAPANVPQSAMLVADDPTGYFFNFETANDLVQALLPSSMTVQRVNVRTEPSTAQARADLILGFNQGRALVNYSGHGNVDVWTGASIFTSDDATALTNGNKLSFVVVMDCLNGYFQDPTLLSLAEALVKAPGGGAVAVFASSGLTLPEGQHEMSQQLYTLIYGGPPIAMGDAIKIAKGFTTDLDVRSTWIFFGDPSMKIR